MEDLVRADPRVWRNRSVLVTGHTGFKGGWLSLWLSQLGAKVHGLALAPPTRPGFFEVTGLSDLLASDVRCDVRDEAGLAATFAVARPSVIMHLAAQPLVIQGYTSPIETFDVNILGTAKVLEAARMLDSLKAVLVVTTDKVYDNKEWAYPYRENDPLGGHDPYSASKGAAEIVSASYRSSYFGAGGHPARVATARAGNVIGGGDWAADRLIPDCFRAFEADQQVQLRYPQAVRPWQHVLDPVEGYIRLAARLLDDDGQRYAKAWNFGPDPDSDATVGEVAALTCRLMGDEARYRVPEKVAVQHEASNLKLDSSLARTELSWRPRWALSEAVGRTVDWHKAWREGQDMRAFSLAQIEAHVGSV